ncbi:NUDIX hydrolase [Lapillicoccus jejuensis]|uniref:8-oxo-dGTP pyrophosphatase MutT (NUDIX family) n=1 Tax=Lapillicoccus jejuensis TaxID=402171 RepID=A0A542DW50_9MICO|nr:NUDIX domain-containing protein [Lapillicoccus jejuensis]TQJ07313.1 8-oxo-dGTP pyrophosphatase MutT (NUDIX family) [Lapillicoccus jejuensis]
MTDDGAPPGTPYGVLHADAVRVLTAWEPPAAARGPQELLRRDFLDHLARHPDGVAKAGPPAHLTASCVVLDADLAHVLLTHHRKARQWYQLGGHVEPLDRSLRAAAEREAREEGGIEGLRVTLAPVQLDRHRLVGAFGRCAEHLDVRYAAVAPAGARPVVSAESHDVRWWPVDDLPPGTAAELRAPVDLARAALAADPARGR